MAARGKSRKNYQHGNMTSLTEWGHSGSSIATAVARSK